MFSRLTKALSFVEEQLGGLLLITSVLLIVFQIVLRSVFGFGISGIYEIATFCVVWSVFLTAGLGVKRNVHVRVDVFMRMVPPKVAFLMEIGVCAILAIIGCALVYTGWLLVEESLIFRDSTLGTIRIPMWIPQMIAPIGGVLILVHTVGRFIAVWRGAVPIIDDSETLPPI